MGTYTFRWSALLPYLPMFGLGLLVTFEVSIASELLAIIIGLIAGMARLSRLRAAQAVAVAYIDFFRGVPLLVTLVWIYYGVSLIFHINISAFVAGVSGLGVTYGAFLAEVFRAGIEAIPKGQTEAAYSLGLSRAKTMRHVILPQALRVIFPPLANSFIGMLKDSSLVAILSVTDLMRVGMIVAADTFRAFEAYTFVAVIYYIVTFITARIVSRLERRLATPH
ncbi:MAG TPA: amino acid ABC transporter permease [Acetobacteraceae bacterium]